MMDEPTRGIDVGAKYEIYELIIKMAKQARPSGSGFLGNAEILGITNRIGVMSNDTSLVSRKTPRKPIRKSF